MQIEVKRSIPAAVLLTLLLCNAGATPLGAGSEPPGEANFTAAPNRLIDESSPYLLLHARNPVDWYPWGEEALERARCEGKPIFLSVGYSTCYWCHVMEREVFSDPEIAALMNRLFVNIKVDREERPDLDEIYMTATQLLTGSGGWPNSVFLTPELEPFFAGTYFPPENRYGRPGFPTVLAGIQDAWQNRRAEVEARSKQVAAAIRQVIAEEREPALEPPAPAVAEQAAAALKGRFDPDHGGFGGPPKFPSPGNLLLAWHLAERGDAEARRMVLETLERMGRGAIYDQLDGGFHRYTLDADWRIPHFEKMLYDNAHLAELLAAAWGAERDPRLERLLRGTLDFVLEEMTLPGGAFKSAIDAETDGEEGAFYTWTAAELGAALGPEGFALLAPVFALDGPPNFEGEKYTLYLARPLDELAAERKTEVGALLGRLEPHLQHLAAVRRQRPFPRVDDKVLTDWNGMMIGALARAGSLLEERRYLEAAGRAARFLLAQLRDADGDLLHVWRAGEARIPAFLDDYAYLLRALLALDRATGEAPWLAEARRLAEEMERRLGDPTGGYFASAGRPDLLFRAKTITDGAVPSGNGIAILGLVELAERTGEEVYRARAERALRAFAADLERFGAAVPVLALATLRFHETAPGAARAAAPSPGPAPATRLPATGETLARRVVRARARWAAGGEAAPWRPFEVGLEIAPGWHVNANPASLEFLLPTAVRGSVRRLVYPPGESLRFAFAEDELAVYGGEATIRGEAEAGAESVELLYQACDDRRCLPPVTLTLPLEPATRRP